MKKGLYFICACTLVAQVSHAGEKALALMDAAQPLDGFPYATLFLGATWIDSTRKTNDVNELHVKYKNGFMASLAAGYHTTALKYQAEFLKLENDHDQFKLDDTRTTESGSTQLDAFLLSAYFLFSHETDIIQPYLGGGVGYGKIESTATGTVNGTYFYNNTSDRKFVWHGAAGLDLNIEPRWDLLLEYRHIGANKAEHSIGDHLDVDVVLLGINYNF